MSDVRGCPMFRYRRIRREATLLAGGIHDLTQRATVYHHIFEHSGRNHVFPLLAAHGALWASGYFRVGMRIGRLASLGHALSPHKRRSLLRQLADYADAYRDINRRVCVETYAIYHLTRDPGLETLARQHVPAELLEPMARCHAARRADRELNNSEKRALFAAFFLWEQANIVGPSIEQANQWFNWTSMKFVALRPTVRFAYFPSGFALPFRDFADTSERIERGLQAFDAAVPVGWSEVENALRRYRLMPEAFFYGTTKYFREIHRSLTHDAGVFGPIGVTPG